MKRIAINSVFAILVLAGLGFTFRGPLLSWIRERHLGGAHSEHAPGSPQGGSSQAKPGERKVLYYQDQMNPAHRTDKPGADSMGMPFLPVYADEAETASALPPGAVALTAQKQQLIGVRTEVVKKEEVFRTLRTVAQIQADETRIAHIHVKVSGWVDKVYVDFVGQLVRKGQPLFTLYSPDLVSTQEEYLIARRGKTSLGSSPFPEVSQGADSLLRSARQRLQLWDISEEQIKNLDETGEVSRTLTLYSPISGFVLDRKVYSQVAVTPDMDLYAVADLSSVWALADIYEYEAPYVRVGQTVEMQLDYFPGKTFSGKVTYINPQVDPQTRTLKARVEFANPEFNLKPGMFAQASVKIQYGSQILVPQEAVLDSGMHQTVFVAGSNGHFEPRTVETGPRLDDKIIVLSGLKEGETIVTSGNFLIDSESRLKSAIGDMKQ
jgi:Cu(I)/Ag(I) efflux system membrane fusion protein